MDQLVVLPENTVLQLLQLLNTLPPSNDPTSADLRNTLATAVPVEKVEWTRNGPLIDRVAVLDRPNGPKILSGRDSVRFGPIPLRMGMRHLPGI